MERKDTYAFLLRVAIPKVKNKDNIPQELNGKSDLLWDCIWRAHRDVMVGYGRAAENCYKCFSKDAEGDHQPNAIAVELYRQIKRGPKPTAKSLIKSLLDKFGDEESENARGVPATRLGAICKLVDMTLKYILIFQLFEVNDDSLPELDSSECDCPIDSVILDSLELGDQMKWTQLSFDDYKKAQDKVCERLGAESDEPILWDFRNWPPKDDLVAKVLSR